MGCDTPGWRDRMAFTLAETSVQLRYWTLAVQGQVAPFPPSPLEPQTEDAGKTGQDTHSYHGVTGFHTAGPTDVAQGSLAAASGKTCNPYIQVNWWAKCSTFLGNTLLTVIAESLSRICCKTVLLMVSTRGCTETVYIGRCIFAWETSQGESFTFFLWPLVLAYSTLLLLSVDE